LKSLKKFLEKPQIIQGMTLSTLVGLLARHRFEVDAQCYGRLAYLLAFSVFNSVYGACENLFNSEDIRNSEIIADPIFIIGHWRSGTTHLHNLMSLDERFTYPTAFQATYPHHFIFSQVGGVVFDQLAPNKRPMDNVAFSANVPHEDEFALAAYSTISPYMRVLFPRTGAGVYSEPDVKLLPPEDLARWKNALILFLKKITLSENKRIVLKSPPHMGRIAVLLEMFPKAKFVHIVRDPYNVYASTHKLWKDSLAYAHLQIPGPELVDELILTWYRGLFDLYERDKHLIPDGSLYEIKFEDLEANPEGIMRGIYDNLGLGNFELYRPKLRAYIRSLGEYQKNSHQITRADREKVSTYWHRTFEQYGYHL
jgi:omega-hydroxy-beta-dihydromenaquinone-9 sulfotransferase